MAVLSDKNILQGHFTFMTTITKKWYAAQMNSWVDYSQHMEANDICQYARVSVCPHDLPSTNCLFQLEVRNASTLPRSGIGMSIRIAFCIAWAASIFSLGTFDWCLHFWTLSTACSKYLTQGFCPSWKMMWRTTIVKRSCCSPSLVKVLQLFKDILVSVEIHHIFIPAVHNCAEVSLQHLFQQTKWRDCIQSNHQFHQVVCCRFRVDVLFLERQENVAFLLGKRHRLSH